MWVFFCMVKLCRMGEVWGSTRLGNAFFSMLFADKVVIFN